MTNTKHTSDGGSSDYYVIPPECREIQDLVEYRNMNFAMGNIFKACWRIGRKEGIDDIYDLNKIIFFAEREKARLTKKNEKKNSIRDVQLMEFDHKKLIGFQRLDGPTGLVFSKKINIPAIKNVWYNYNSTMTYPWREYKLDTWTKVKVEYENGMIVTGRFKDFSWGNKGNYTIAKWMLV